MVHRQTHRVLVGNALHMQYIPQWTGWDYTLENMPAHITMPGTVRFYVTGQKPSSRSPRVVHKDQASVFHGIPQTSTLYWKSLRMSDTVWSDPEYVRAYKAAGDEVRSLVGHARDYILVHFRGMDHNTWRPDEAVLGRENYCTGEVLRALHGTGAFMRVISNNYTDTLRWLRGLPSIEIVHLGNAFTDLQLLLDAAGIVQHSVFGWSAYSSVPAMARSIPLISTYQGREHRYGIFAQHGDVPEEFHTCQQLPAFLDAVRARLA